MIGAATLRQRGFTLVELIITIVIVGILAALGSSMISNVFTTSRLVNTRQSSADEARYALERLAREIREVEFLGGETLSPPVAHALGKYNIDAFGSSNMTFTNASGVIVTITWSQPQLTLGYSSPAVTATLASQVTKFSLSYLTADGVTETTNKNLVRFVVISLTVTDSASASGQAVQQQTRVALRNA